MGRPDCTLIKYMQQTSDNDFLILYRRLGQGYLNEFEARWVIRNPYFNVELYWTIV